MNVKNLFLAKCALSFFVVMCYLSSSNPGFSADQRKPTISKKPAIGKKHQTEKTTDKQPQIYIEEKEHNIGAIYEGMVATHDFKIKNKGDGDLLIKRVKPG